MKSRLIYLQTSVIVSSGINSALKSDSIYESESFVNRIHVFINSPYEHFYTKSFTLPFDLKLHFSVKRFTNYYRVIAFKPNYVSLHVKN